MNRWIFGIGIIGLCGSLVGCGDVDGPLRPSGPVVTPGPPSSPPPDATATYRGVVWEPGGGPLAGVSVAVRGGAAAVTDGEGRFSVAGVRHSIVSFASEGFLTRYFRAAELPGGPSDVALPLQRALRIEIPGSVTARLFPDDPTYLTETEEIFWYSTETPRYDCSPCKTFWLSPPMKGRPVQVRVRWSAPVALTVSLGGHYEGVMAQQTAAVGEREVTVQTSSTADTLLIGMASPSGIRQTIPGPIDLHIDVTLP